MENPKHKPKNSDANNDNHHNSEKKHLDSLFPHIVNSDINLQVGFVSVIVFNNCTSIYIEGKTTKIYFEIPSTDGTSHSHSNDKSSNDNKAEHRLKENVPADMQSPTPQSKHKQETESEPQDPHDHNHDNDHNHEDEIDLSCEGVQILLCDCCTILKVKGPDTDLTFPLSNFKNANLILTEENGYYVRRYNIELIRHISDEKDQKIKINNHVFAVKYSPSTKLFYHQNSFNGFNNIIDIVADILKSNPDLIESKHLH